MAPFNCVYDYQFSAEATGEPVTLEEVKEWLRIDIDEDDDLVTSLITAARVTLEHYLNQSLIKRTVTTVINNSCGNQFLPFQPFDELISISDCSGDSIAEGSYTLIGNQFKRLVDPCEDNITLVYTTGLDEISQALKTGIKQQVAFMYENRGDDTKDIYTAVSPMVKSILKSYRR